MSRTVNRRQFLRVSGPLAFGTQILISGTSCGTSPPAPAPAGAGLKVIAGEGLVALPSGASRRLGSPHMRTPRDVKAIQFAPRGSTLVAATGSELRAWDWRTGKILFRLNYPEQSSIPGGRLTTGDSFALLVKPYSGESYAIRQYAFGTGKLVSESPPLDLGEAQHTAFSADGSLVAIIRKEALYLYDAKGAEKWHDPLPPEAVGGLRFSPDGTTIAVSAKGEVKLYSAATGKMSSSLKVGDVNGKETPGGHGRDWLGEAVVSADGKWLAAAVGEDNDWVFCWDVKAETVKHRLKAARPVGFNPDGSELFTFKDMVATCWTLATGAVARAIDVPADNELTLSPDGKILASMDGDSVILIDAVTGKHLAHSSNPPGLPTALRFEGKNRLVGLLPGWGGWIEWDVAADTSRLVRPTGVGGHTPVSLSTGGRVALYRKQAEYTARELATGKVLLSATGAEGIKDATPTGAITPDGQSLVEAVENGLTVVTVKGRNSIPRPGAETGGITALAVSGDSRLAAAAYSGAGEQSSIDLYHLGTGKYLRSLRVDGDVSSMAFSGNSALLLVAHDSQRHGRGGLEHRSIDIYDPETGRAVFRSSVGGYQEPVLALSPDGRMLAQVESDGDDKYKIAVWEVQSNSPRIKFTVGGSPTAFAFAPDGRTFAASIPGGPVFVWDLHAPAKDAKPVADLNQSWNDLRAADAAVAFNAIKHFASTPATAAPFLREKLLPISPPDIEQVKRMIGDLDHKDYRRREKAMRGLVDLGERVREPLRQALTSGPTPEVRERIERLIAAEERPSPEHLRRMRAVEAMEVAGTKEAQEVLAYWASGAPGALFTRDADAAIKRLALR